MKGEAGHADVPNLTLERYALGELPESERLDLERRIGAEPGLRQRLEALRRSDREVRERYPAPGLARGVRMRLTALSQRPPWRPPARWPLPAALAAAALVAVAVAPELLDPRGPGPAPVSTDVAPEGIRFKGSAGATLTLHRKTDAGSEVLGEGALASEGDLIRLAYHAADRQWGVIVSVDGHGSVTLHLPQRGAKAARLQGGGRVLLDFAYELDDAPRWEVFYLVTGKDPFEVAPVLAAARELEGQMGSSKPPRLFLPNGLDQYVVSLMKGVAQ